MTFVHTMKVAGTINQRVMLRDGTRSPSCVSTLEVSRGSWPSCQHLRGSLRVLTWSTWISIRDTRACSHVSPLLSPLRDDCPRAAMLSVASMTLTSSFLHQGVEH